MVYSVILAFLALSGLALGGSPRHGSNSLPDSTDSPPDSSPDSSSGPDSSDVYYVATAWYAGWHAQDFTPENITWDRYTSAIYSFAVPTNSTADVLQLNETDAALLPQFVTAAHENNVTAALSIGGWTGSMYFSSAVGSPKNRTALVKSIANLVKTYELDGIDFDWEYPGTPGVGCNVYNTSDTANFLLLLQELRESPLIPKNLTLSAAVGLKPFVNETGLPSEDVSDFAKVLDYIAIMNYDVWGSWSSTTGPNAPLNDTCYEDVGRQQGSAFSAVRDWFFAGIPVNQIVLGVPSYGHTFQVKPTDAYMPPNRASRTSSTSAKILNPYARFNVTGQPAGDKWDDLAGPDICGVEQLRGGNMDFWALQKFGWLGLDGKPSKGIEYSFDECSQTPILYNATAQVMIAYDNAQSFAAKGDFIREYGLRGFAMWEAGGDFNNTLVDSIRQSIGLDECFDMEDPSLGNYSDFEFDDDGHSAA